MAFRTDFSIEAVIDLDEYTLYLSRTASPSVVKKWVKGLNAQVRSLRTMPSRYAIIPEAGSWPEEYRSFNYHSHRVVYRVDSRAKVVTIIRLYHSARQPIKPEDLD